MDPREMAIEWTGTNITYIKTHYGNGKQTSAQIATALGTTPNAIRSKVYRLGRINFFQHNLWTEEDHELLVFLRCHLGLPCWAIGALLDRSKMAVQAHAKKHKLLKKKAKITRWLTPSNGQPSIKATRQGVDPTVALPAATLSYINKHSLWGATRQPRVVG